MQGVFRNGSGFLYRLCLLFSCLHGNGCFRCYLCFLLYQLRFFAFHHVFRLWHRFLFAISGSFEFPYDGTIPFQRNAYPKYLLPLFFQWNPFLTRSSSLICRHFAQLMFPAFPLQIQRYPLTGHDFLSIQLHCQNFFFIQAFQPCISRTSDSLPIFL